MEKKTEIDQLRNSNIRAAVDSELALVQAGAYELDGWVQNPYFLGLQKIVTC
ncbi:MAG: hypothetical protein GY799_08755 [Desulfobulbaceae bacterium]|nr:hypothetical protein [Desulfobulbaceae bacterium]